MPSTRPSSYPRGSEWRKWDLHVHTPASIVNHYRGHDPEDKWEKFLADIERLPPEFKVLGINDYLFLDGYRRVLEERAKGRLANIDGVFPVVELRLRDFCGTDSRLQKVNLHILFSADLDPGIIESQFLGSIRTDYKLDPAIGGGVSWCAAPDRDSLEDLGRRIIEQAPAEKRRGYKSALLVGFGALVYELRTIRERLSNTHHFHGKYVIAVGKTEWADIRWTDGAALAKKDIINGADLVFVASDTPAAYSRARSQLQDAHVNSRLLDCSDAHWNSNSTEKDRIGNCFTWVKADPTLEGLKLAVREFDDRVFVGDEPPLLTRVKSAPTKFIDSVSFAKKPTSHLQEKWMDGVKVEFNPGLVAIIGNRGSGKSALSDTIGLLGNTKQYRDFSFLSDTKFRDPKSGTKAENFEATMTWASGGAEPAKNLNTNPAEGAVELVKYIPQNYLETICNEVRRLEEGEFDRELKSVVFSHVDPTETLGCADLDALIKYKTKASRDTRDRLVTELGELNASIVALEREASPERKAELENAIKQKELELDAHDKSEPPAMIEPKADPDSQARTEEITARMIGLDKELGEADEAIRQAQTALETANRREAAAQRLLDKLANLRRSYSAFVEECRADAGLLGLAVESLVEIRVDTSRIDELLKGVREEQQARRRELDRTDPTSLVSKRTRLDEDLKALRSQLDEPNRKYQTYRAQLKDWFVGRARIVGDQATPGSLEYLKSKLNDLANIPARLTEKRKQREAKVREIHDKIAELADSYRVMFRGVDDFVHRHPLAAELAISFKVDIVPMKLEDEFLGLINQKRAGTFCGADEGRERLRHLVAPVQFHDREQVLDFLRKLEDALTHDRRSPRGEATQVEGQLRKGVEVKQLYDCIYSLSYLQPRYLLEWEGKDLSVLSPGERGTLLLAFYLLIDRSTVPLVIDQPEENLDNETVFKVLVKCLKDAKKRRQVIIVTHNPNLAVVCDADQVIYANIDKQDGNRIDYESGAIENPAINKHIVDVLEGTKPAFRNRDDKYEAVTSAGGGRE